MKRALLALLLAASVFGQGIITISSTAQGKLGSPRYEIVGTGTTSDVVTVQQVALASAVKNVYFEEATVSCSGSGATCSFTVEQNGTAATSTAGTIQALNNSPASTVKAWTGSNVGTGAFVSHVYQLATGQNVTVDLSKMFLAQNGGTGNNLTIRASGTSSTLGIQIEWTEQ